MWLRFFTKKACFLLLILLPILELQAEIVRIPLQQGESNKLGNTILTAALERGARYQMNYPFGDIDNLPLSARIQAVRNKEVDIFFALSTPEYEEEFQAVYIPIYKGMMGMRLAILKKENINLLKDVQSLKDLSKFSAGQGKLWADSKILEHNGLPLVKELKYSNLFRMLEADRFEIFPRGIHEPWSEIKQHEKLNLAVDPHIMLWYKVPFYFFVHKSNRELAQHLTQQLNAMISEGSYENIFENDNDVRLAIENANISERKIIHLDNPYLTNNTPLEREVLWFVPHAQPYKLTSTVRSPLIIQ